MMRRTRGEKYYIKESYTLEDTFRDDFEAICTEKPLMDECNDCSIAQTLALIFFAIDCHHNICYVLNAANC
jgi:hypothetical protein